MKALLLATVLAMSAALGLAAFVLVDPELSQTRSDVLATARIEPAGEEQNNTQPRALEQAPLGSQSNPRPIASNQAGGGRAPGAVELDLSSGGDIVVTTTTALNSDGSDAVPRPEPARVPQIQIQAPAPVSVTAPAGVSLEGFDGITVSIPPSD